MRSPSRLTRNVCAAAVITGLALGTVLWQTDDTWPLAQMRMFPGGGESAVSIVVIEARLANGHRTLINPFAFHLKRAEIEGQMGRVRADPRMIGDLVAAYNSTVARPAEIVELVMTRRETVRSGAHLERVEKELVRWPG